MKWDLMRPPRRPRPGVPRQPKWFAKTVWLPSRWTEQGRGVRAMILSESNEDGVDTTMRRSMTMIVSRCLCRKARKTTHYCRFAIICENGPNIDAALADLLATTIHTRPLLTSNYGLSKLRKKTLVLQPATSRKLRSAYRPYLQPLACRSEQDHRPARGRCREGEDPRANLEEQ